MNTEHRTQNTEHRTWEIVNNLKGFWNDRLNLFFDCIILCITCISIISCKNEEFEKELISLSIVQYPSKMLYVVGEKINLQNLKVIGSFSDNTEEEIKDYSISPSVDSTFRIVGKQKITILYLGKEAFFDVTIVDARLKFTEQPDTLITGSLYADYSLKFKVSPCQNGCIKFVLYRQNSSEKDFVKILETDSIKIESGKEYETSISLPNNEYLDAKYYCEALLDGENFYQEGKSQNIHVKQSINTGLKLIEINTINQEEPTCDYVSAPPYENGAGITNATKVPGGMTICKADEILYSSGEYEKDISGMTIKIRGNTSAYGNKKPYKIKLEKKADLLSRNNESKYKDKEWLLLKTGTNISNVVGCSVNKLLNNGYTPSYEYVDFVMNGIYRGTYVLSESIERNTDCRINVEKVEKGGYIFEFDAYYWNEDGYVTSKSGRRFTFKYPDYKDMTDNQKNTIVNAISDLEDSIISGGKYGDLMDVDSWSLWLLGRELLGDCDAAGGNIYLTRNNNSSKIKMGPLWDFEAWKLRQNDFATIHYWGNNNAKVTYNSEGYYFPLLFGNTNTFFKENYKHKWKELSDEVCTEINSTLNNFATNYGESVDKSRRLDGIRWNCSTQSVGSEISSAQEWFSSRVTWLNEHIPKL